ncbi:enoyl-CoA hydratase/isomerase family protein [soil metagenome]
MTEHTSERADFTALTIERRGTAPRLEGWIWMSRPQLHNAFDEVLIEELTRAFALLDADEDVRVIVLAGQGKSFSAGADLNWMRRLGTATYEKNLEDARGLATLYRTISECRTPTLARVHGAAIGGGMGLAAACDICIASTTAAFAASEVRLGIIPSAISPYVVRAMGERQAYRYFQTGERISAERAREIGLAHEAVPPDELDATVGKLIESLLACGPMAQAASIDLIRAVVHKAVDDGVVADTAERIAKIRATPEAQEGLSAFLDKRPASWTLS